MNNIFFDEFKRNLFDNSQNNGKDFQTFLKGWLIAPLSKKGSFYESLKEGKNIFVYSDSECSNAIKDFNNYQKQIALKWFDMLLNTSDDKLSEKNYKAKKILLSMPDFKKYLNLDGAAKLTNELFDTYNVRSVCFDCGIDKYIDMRCMNNNDSTSQKERFARIYVGLSPKFIVEFIKELDKRCVNLDYKYKFHSLGGSDKIVIYPNNECLLQICKEITQIRINYPNLFINAEDKFLTTKIVEGVSLASNFNESSFTSEVGSLIKEYVGKIFKNYCNKFKVFENTESVLKKIIKNNNDSDRECSVNEIIEELKSSIEKDKRLVKFPSLKFPYVETLRLYYQLMCENGAYPHSVLDSMSLNYNELRYSKFLEFVENKNLSLEKRPSKKNIAFTDKELKLLQELIHIYSHYESSNAKNK